MRIDLQRTDDGFVCSTCGKHVARGTRIWCMADDGGDTLCICVACIGTWLVEVGVEGFVYDGELRMIMTKGVV